MKDLKTDAKGMLIRLAAGKLTAFPFNAKVLEDPIETEWASITIVEATHKLFRAARDADCDVFVGSGVAIIFLR